MVTMPRHLASIEELKQTINVDYRQPWVMIKPKTFLEAKPISGGHRISVGG
jgi:hypothetical protein